MNSSDPAPEAPAPETPATDTPKAEQPVAVESAVAPVAEAPASAAEAAPVGEVIAPTDVPPAEGEGDRHQPLNIADELKDSYLTYAMMLPTDR